ncbi:MAG: hypothetical protein ISP90_13930 [Nevskia sp.]|nr:hypothetical protein [Nevskia sp.]
MQVPLFLAYPVLAHLAVELQLPWLQCAAVLCACAAVFYRALRAGSAAAWAGLAACAGALLALQRMGGGRWVLFLPSVMLPALVLSAFAVSLLPGRVALVTRFARAMDGALSEEQVRYTRAVTWLWVVATAALLAVTLLLIAFASVQAWSVFANFISYSLIGLLFAAEYLYRRHRFPQHAHPDFIAFVRGLSRYRPR